MLARLNLPGSLIALRRATPDDLPAIVGLLADDPLGRTREAVTAADGFGPYERAFAAIDTDPAQLLVVATDGIDVVATMQLSFIPGLARRGALRAQAEAVRATCGVERQGGRRGADRVVRPRVESSRRYQGCDSVPRTTS